MRTLLPLALIALSIACDGGDADPTDSGTSADSGSADTNDVASIECSSVTPAVTDLSPTELEAMLDTKDFQLINVHVPYEGELPQTDANISFQDIDGIEAALGSDKGAKVVVYCKTGPMSTTASNALVERGYCNVHDLPAGMNGWASAGFSLDD